MVLEYLEKNPHLLLRKRVLEVGSGTGVISAYILQNNPRLLVSLDINPYAARVTKCTFRYNNVDGEILVGDLLTSFSSHTKFDLLIFNPPYLPADEYCKNDLLDMAWCGGEGGIEILEKFLKQSVQHMHLNSRLIFLVSSLSNYETLFNEYSSLFIFRNVMERSFFFEKLMLFEGILK